MKVNDTSPPAPVGRVIGLDLHPEVFSAAALIVSGLIAWNAQPIALHAIHGYQRALAGPAARIGLRCRFTPTCSRYAETVIVRDGVARGGLKALARIARQTAQPEVRHVSNTTFLFAALAGWKVAHCYSLTGDHFDAAEALRIGIVNEVVPAAELLPRARALAERIARVPEPSVRLNKAVTCYGLLAMGVGAGMMMNMPLSNLAHASYNAQRAELLEVLRSGGLRAFLEARDGEFRPEPFGPKSAPRKP